MILLAHRIAKRKVKHRTKRLIAAYLLIPLIDWATRGPRIPKQRSLNYTLGNISAEYCLEVARFYPDDVRRIRRLLHLEEEYVTPTRVRYYTDDALLLLCWRFASTEKFKVLVTHFTWNDLTTCKLILNDLLGKIYHIVLPLLLGNSPLFTPEHIEKSAQFIAQAFGLDYAIIFAFVDAKLWRTCKPAIFQRAIYNGGKHKAHGLAGQSIVDAFGLLMHFFCPISGRYHDAHVWAESGVYALLERVLGNRVKALIGDSAYPHSNRLLPMAKRPRTEEQRTINSFKAALRVSVEHGQNKIGTLFPLLDKKRQMRILLSPVGVWINVAAFLTNCHTLLYGSQVADFYYCRAEVPTLEEYIVLPQ